MLKQPGMMDWTAAPQGTMKFAAHLHKVGTLKTMPKAWTDYYLPIAARPAGQLTDGCAQRRDAGEASDDQHRDADDGAVQARLRNQFIQDVHPLNPDAGRRWSARRTRCATSRRART